MGQAIDKKKTVDLRDSSHQLSSKKRPWSTCLTERGSERSYKQINEISAEDFKKLKGLMDKTEKEQIRFLE